MSKAAAVRCTRQRWPLLVWFCVLITHSSSTIGATLVVVPLEDDDRRTESEILGPSPAYAYSDEGLQAASDSLASMGIRGLCHPTTNDYAPIFPQCTPEHEKVTVAGGMEQKRRQLDYSVDDDDSDLQMYEEDGQPTKWYYIVHGSLALLCVIGGALAAGLTVGLLSLDPLLLLIKVRAGATPEERYQAATLLPIVKKHHDLLVTLLLMNTVAGESLPVFLQGIVPGSVAILISVVLVLVFGEILPTALFVGPNQLKLASRLAPVVRVLMVILAPVAYPIARLLDRIMRDEDSDGTGGDGGGHGTMYNRGELSALIRVQHEERLAAKQRRRHQRTLSLSGGLEIDMSDLNIAEGVRVLKAELTQLQHNQPSPVPPSDSLDNDEVMIMEGALQMKMKTAMDIHLSYHKVFCIPADMELDDTNIFTIYASGYSRVPVFVDNDRRLVKGILMTRQLMVVKKRNTNNSDSFTEDHQIVADLNLHIPQCVPPHTNLLELVNLFQTGGTAVRSGHMALVCARPDIANAALDQDQAIPEEAGLMGIITLEDVLEALLQEQIYDEMDAAGRMPIADEIEPSVENPESYRLA